MTMLPWTPELFQASQTEANSCRELTKIVLRAEEPDDDGIKVALLDLYKI